MNRQETLGRRDFLGMIAAVGIAAIVPPRMFGALLQEQTRQIGYGWRCTDIVSTMIKSAARQVAEAQARMFYGIEG